MQIIEDDHRAMLKANNTTRKASDSVPDPEPLDREAVLMRAELLRAGEFDDEEPEAEPPTTIQ